MHVLLDQVLTHGCVWEGPYLDEPRGSCRFLLRCCKTTRCVSGAKPMGKTCVAVGFLWMFEDLACWRQPGDIASPWLVQVLARPG